MFYFIFFLRAFINDPGERNPEKNPGIPWTGMT